MEQCEYRIPSTGEAWRHYKGGLYTIIGMGSDENGNTVVVYTPYRWSLAQLPPIYTREIGNWMQVVDDGPGHKIPRFEYDREPDGEWPFVPTPPR